MKFKLVLLLMLPVFAISHANAQKVLPKANPVPQPPATPVNYYAMGYKNGFNLIVTGHTSTYSNSLTAAAQSGNTDYYMGLLEGGAAGNNALMKPIKPTPQIGSYDIIPVVQIPQQFDLLFYFTDGSIVTLSYNEM